MNDDHDPVLSAAGARLRGGSSAISATSVELAVLRRRQRRTRAVAGAALAAVAALGGLLFVGRDDGDAATERAAEPVGDRPGAPTVGKVEQLLSDLDRQPVDPTEVQLVRTVSTFADCDGLIGDLRQVGAEHVGSRGFGGFTGGYGAWAEGDTFTRASASTGLAADGAALSPYGPQSAPADETTLGTNVQVEGVDELDHVKAVGKLLYDLDGKGDLRITDVAAGRVLATLDVTPKAPSKDGQVQVDQLLVAGGRVAVFGSEVEVSTPVAGDPSATQAATSFLTVTMVDVADPATPAISDRVRVEGALVSARLVDGEVRLVTTSNMADLGFVMPTTPTSVARALEQNRRSVASSTVPDWIPDWQRADEDPQPLVPCERVHVPDTFSGVAMTSMVTFPLGARFEPAGTSILAPATTLYAGLEKVAISSEVWVDPVDRERLEFDDWQTAVHEFSFTDGGAPGYEGSGIVDGSTIGQFAFGEIGDALAVVTTQGTPWEQDPEQVIDLTVLTPDGDGALEPTSKVADLADGQGEVTAVRFVEGRVLVSTGFFGRAVHVIDVTDPAAPRRAGRVVLPGSVGYFHPLPDQQALVISSRSDTVGEGKQKRSRSWVTAQLLDVADADAPAILSTWERPWTSDEVGYDHHAFTYWPDRKLAMWGLQNTNWGSGPNLAAVLSTDGAVTEVAVPEASKPNEVPPPCPVVEVTDAEVRELIGVDGVVLRCGDPAQKELVWPRYGCYRVDDGTVRRFAPGQDEVAAYFLCSPAPHPSVGRVLVVSGVPMLYTEQTLEALDPTTFASTSVLYLPSSGGMVGY